MVANWIDESGNTRNAVAPIASRPRYRLNSLNGLPALQFDGMDDYLDLGTAMLIPNVSSFAIIVVANIISNNGTGNDLFSAGGSVGDSWGVTIRQSNCLAVPGGAALSADYVDPPINTWHVYIWERSGSNFRAYIDGGTATIAGSSAGALRGSGSNGFLEKSVINSFWNNGTANGSASSLISDIVVLNNQTAANLNAFGNHFKSKYALPWINII